MEPKYKIGTPLGEFDSLTAACEAHGCTYMTLKGRLNNEVSRYYLIDRQGQVHAYSPQEYAKRHIVYQGKVYDNVRDVAQVAGYCEAYIHLLLRQGDGQEVVIPMNCKSKYKSRKALTQYVIDGKTYNGLGQAHAATGVPTATLYRLGRNNNYVFSLKGHMAGNGERLKRKVRTPMGEFDSVLNAAIAHRVSYAAMSRRLRNVQKTEYFYLD